MHRSASGIVTVSPSCTSPPAPQQRSGMCGTVSIIPV
jgi:hypothetical protein